MMNNSARHCLLFFISFSFLFILYRSSFINSFASAPSANSIYGADSFTTLFDDFEDTNLASASFGTIGYDSGYLSGRALKFTDTTSALLYSDSWWLASDNDQDSGSIEYFVRIDTFYYSNNTPYTLALTRYGRPNVPSSSGNPEFGFSDCQAYFAISVGAPYDEITSNEEINPGQWYHIAASWGQGAIRLFVNGIEVDSQGSGSTIDKDTFYIGAPSFLTGNAVGFVGRIDRLRISTKPRLTGEFPSALGVRIDSPIQNIRQQLPIQITYEAYASDTRARTVDLYQDTDDAGYNGSLIASNLSESGTVSVTFNPLADTIYIYAVAKAGDDRAYAYCPWQIYPTINLTQLKVGSQSEIKLCLIERMTSNSVLLNYLRMLRDIILNSTFGRFLVWLYYSLIV